jgi:hypothetical protein
LKLSAGVRWKEGPLDLHTGTRGFQGPQGGGTIQPVKQILSWLIIVGAMLVAFLLSRSRQSHLDVTPDAQHEIDKAKRR